MSDATFTTTYRGSITDIASIARWLVSEGVTPRSRNEIVNVAVVNFVKNLTTNWPEHAITTDADALGYLTELGLIGKNLKNMQPALSKSFWASSPAASQQVSNDFELSEKAQRAGINKTAADVMELMRKADKRNQNDAEMARKLADASNLPIAEDESE